MSARLGHRAERCERFLTRHFSRLTLGLLPLAALALVLTTLPLLQVAENRLVPGRPLDAHAALGAWLWPFLVFGVAGYAMLTEAAKRPVAALLIAVAFLLVIAGLGETAASLSEALPKPGRVRLGTGALLMAALLIATLVFALRSTPRWIIGSITVGIGVALLAFAWTGTFEALSIVIEYRARADALNVAVLEHSALTFGALVLAIATVLFLYPLRAMRFAFEQIAAGLQVVPAVALLGALVAALSALLAVAPGLREWGVTALGPVPALCGIAAYLLLPLWRGLHAGLSAADPDSLNAGEALGMTQAQVLARIRLPQGAPVLIGAVRIATVQSLGLATLGALVGAGGLGRIVFDGMAQYAPDLILLGALPIALLAWLADSALSLLEAHSRRS